MLGVALALVTVSFNGTVASNEFATTTTAAPTTTTSTLAPGDGLQAAISTTGAGQSPCETAIATESLSLGAISFDLNNPSAQSYTTPAFLCVKNSQSGAGNGIATLTASVSVDATAEDGCSEDEKTTDPEGPTDCGTLGELGTVIQVVLVPASLGDPDCFSGTQSLTLGGATVSLLRESGELTQGLFCSWEVQLQLSGSATYDQKLAASTDSITLRLDVNGSGTG